VTPGKGGQDVEGIPVFNTVAEAASEAGANTTLIFVPARFAVDAVYEAVDAGIATVICITEHIPAHDMLRVYTYIRPLGSHWSGLTARVCSRLGRRTSE
jgi:succinyl-CoA synthetase alpha subunit